MWKVILMLCSIPLFAQEIVGHWKTIDDKTGKPRCVIRIFEYEDRCYGQIISTFDDAGTSISESIGRCTSLAPGLVGDPPYCGLIIMWDFEDVNNKYKGKIIDPDKGNIYDAALWLTDDDSLNVQGKWLVFWRNQTWLKAEVGDYPANTPPLSNYLPPAIPQAK